MGAIRSITDWLITDFLRATILAAARSWNGAEEVLVARWICDWGESLGEIHIMVLAVRVIGLARSERSGTETYRPRNLQIFWGNFHKSSDRSPTLVYDIVFMASNGKNPRWAGYYSEKVCIQWFEQTHRTRFFSHISPNVLKRPPSWISERPFQIYPSERTFRHIKHSGISEKDHLMSEEPRPFLSVSPLAPSKSII